MGDEFRAASAGGAAFFSASKSASIAVFPVTQILSGATFSMSRLRRAASVGAKW